MNHGRTDQGKGSPHEGMEGVEGIGRGDVRRLHDCVKSLVLQRSKDLRRLDKIHQVRVRHPDVRGFLLRKLVDAIADVHVAVFVGWFMVTLVHRKIRLMPRTGDGVLRRDARGAENPRRDHLRHARAKWDAIGEVFNAAVHVDLSTATMLSPRR